MVVVPKDNRSPWAVAAISRCGRPLPAGGEAGGLITTVVAAGGHRGRGALVAVHVVGGTAAGQLVDTVVSVRGRCAIDSSRAAGRAVPIIAAWPNVCGGTPGHIPSPGTRE